MKNTASTVLVIALLCGVVSKASAELITFDFLARVTTDAGKSFTCADVPLQPCNLFLRQDDLFTGSYSFDSTTPNVFAGHGDFASQGLYVFSGLPNQILADIGSGYVFDPRFDIVITTAGRFISENEYRISMPNNLLRTFDFVLLGNPGFLTSTDLLVTPPDLGSAFINRGVITQVASLDQGGGRHTLVFTMLELTLRQPDPIPEPTTLALFGLGLFGLGGARRRRISRCSE
jgi:hypothetical protein